jgi:hypothetical protein
MIKERKMRRARHVKCVGKMGNAYTTLGGKPEGKIQLGRPKSR